MNNKQLQIIEEREVLGKQLRIYGDFENPLFLAKDVAEWIDYAKTGNGSYDVNKMLKTVDENEKLIRKIFVSGLSLIYPKKSYKGNVGIKLFSPLLAKTNSKIYCLLNFPHKRRNKNNQRGVYPYWL